MKKLLVIVTIATFTACNGGSNDSSKVVEESVNGGASDAAAANDSITRASDSVMQTGDTTALNSTMGDSTTSSGTHGQGSGSRVGGGKTGEPQGKKNPK